MSAKILYIEDNQDNLALVERAMKAAGYQFVGAEDGQSGLEAAYTALPDIILLDINLPDIDGYEIARRLRASKKPGLVYTPIIAITANAMHGDAAKAIAAGCDVYMSKPINIRELWARVEGMLHSREAV